MATKTRRTFPIDQLHQLLTYSPETGALAWRGAQPPKGHRFGRLPEGYATVTLGGLMLLQHRVIFAMMAGHWPAQEVDHINSAKDDNRWVNLREATPEQNQWNRGIQKNNTSGFKGAYLHPRTKRWFSSITIKHRQQHLGCFDTREEAAEAYKQAAARLRGDFARSE